MHVLKALEIHGFRDQQKPIRIKLDRHANFLIGRNGTGKTTLINLIKACLSFDHQKLRREKWARILMRFRAEGTNVVPQVEITRSSPARSAVLTFSYRESSQADPVSFHFAARDRNLIRTSSGRLVPAGARIREIEQTLNAQVGRLFGLTWLSLARADEPTSDDPWDEVGSMPDVDRKLRHSFGNLVGYFSRLDGQVAAETQEFQKHWFLSFLSRTEVSDISILKDINPEEEEQALRSIFQQFQMDPDVFELQLYEYFEQLSTILKRKNQDILEGWEEIGVVYDALRLHSLVDRWQELQNAQIATYKPKTDFVSVASDLLFRKSLKVDRGNQTLVVNSNNEPIPIESLSSGEKQLLIFLSETLLQEGKPHIFLADEPELSLHIEWQEELVPSLLQLNPNAQVIFATHSPDIVGSFQENVIQMEELI